MVDKVKKNQFTVLFENNILIKASTAKISM